MSVRKDFIFWIIVIYSLRVVVGFGLTIAVLRLCEGGEIEEQMLSLAQMPNRIINVQFSTYAPLLQNRCCAFVVLLSQAITMSNCRNGCMSVNAEILIINSLILGSAIDAPNFSPD